MFALPESLRVGVDFWIKIYAHYDSHQAVFYDTQTYTIYDVLDLPKISKEISSPKYKDDVKKHYTKIADALEMLTSKSRSNTLDPLQKKLDVIIKKNKLENIADLSARLRNQNGLKSQFELGLKMSGRYIDEVEALLKSQGLPTDLVALVFVESLWNINAVSHAGASGPWGIVKETARLSGIHVNRFTDERLDPVIATMAAAQYLKKAKEGLGEWPLAITSYNYGYPGMLRAVAGLNTKKIDVIIDQHDSPIFGYASKNYYQEFKAALYIYQNREKYFPNLTKEQPWNYELVQVLRPVSIKALLSSKAVSKDDLREYNPGLTKYTLEGDEVIPGNYTLRIPKGKSKLFYERLKTIPAKKRERAKWKISTKYHAKGHESLEIISKKIGVIPDYIAEKLGESPKYKPKGVINIRSHSYAFTQLKNIADNIIATLRPTKIADRIKP
ncbi:MAG: lytic transglycosylase domain-containing protein [Myxococcales bacterium]|nr:lytic transglycosylase domain-containing protein [Myxococcales bacterium]